MDRADLLAALQVIIDRFGQTCASADLTAPVPACPGWNLADLLWHVTEVQSFWGAVVAGRLDEPSAAVRPERPADRALTATYRAGAENLLDALRATPDTTEVWTWSHDQTAGWVLRRIVHESAVHLVDAEQAVGSVDGAEPSIDAAIASDGVDEFLEHFAARPGGASPLGGTVHLHCTDVAGEWLVVDGPGDGSLVVTREHAKGDCAIRGEASPMLLALWRRAPLDHLDVIGDADLAARFVARTVQG